MGRPKRILQDELPYHVTTRTVSGLKGFSPDVNQLNTSFQTALAAEWKGNNKPIRNKAVAKLARKVVNMFMTPSQRNADKGIDRRRYDHEAVERRARFEKLKREERIKAARRKRAMRKAKGNKRKGRKKRKGKNTTVQTKSKPKYSRKFSKQWLKQQLKEDKKVEQGQIAFKNLSRYIVVGIIALALMEIVKAGFELHHFVLMDNHYHMIGKAVKETIDRVMHRFNLFIAKQMNQLLGRKGAFFAERYKSNITGTDELGGVLLRYVYQNPVRARVVVVPEDHDFTTYRVYVKGEAFIVDLSGDCPIIERLCPDKERQRKFVKELVRGALPPELAARLRFALRRHVVWMTADTYETLSEELKVELKEHYIKLDESLKRYDLYARM